MKKSDFLKLLERDIGCVHCGAVEAVAPNHRVNRGMGGVGKGSLLNQPSNLVVLCSVVNGLIESDSRWQGVAKEYGWKLERWQAPDDTPVYNRILNQWVLLDNNYGYTIYQAREL